MVEISSNGIKMAFSTDLSLNGLSGKKVLFIYFLKSLSFHMNPSCPKLINYFYDVRLLKKLRAFTWLRNLEHEVSLFRTI